MSRFRSRPGKVSREDDERFHRLYVETSQDLLAFLLRRCLTPEDAADCLSETFRIVWEKRNRIPAGDDARPWLFGVARNVLRRERASTEREAEAAHELGLAAQRSGAITSTNTTALAALASLAPLDQEIITMLAWDDLAPREVAVILGLSPNVVRVRAHRAREQLRNTLAAGVTEGSKTAITPREP
jgi:RNA polymerase sigma-70 factor (ECF subfamily)